ncbi:hypothetical protein EDB85DRAFT_1898145 [Lactarius pseudohatsudake]|nr:hypothetical protein EDB85DRAFT_1898145 [Lactarius pseudohatsudake]
MCSDGDPVAVRLRFHQNSTPQQDRLGPAGTGLNYPLYRTVIVVVDVAVVELVVVVLLPVVVLAVVIVNVVVVVTGTCDLCGSGQCRPVSVMVAGNNDAAAAWAIAKRTDRQSPGTCGAGTFVTGRRERYTRPPADKLETAANRDDDDDDETEQRRRFPEPNDSKRAANHRRRPANAGLIDSASNSTVTRPASRRLQHRHQPKMTTQPRRLGDVQSQVATIAMQRRRQWTRMGRVTATTWMQRRWRSGCVGLGPVATDPG